MLINITGLSVIYSHLLVFATVWTSVRASSNMVEVFVDGKPVMVEPGTTVLQVMMQRPFPFNNSMQGLYIPCFMLTCQLCLGL